MGTNITDAAVMPAYAPASPCLLSDRSAQWQVELVPSGAAAAGAAPMVRHREYAVTPAQGFGGRVGGLTPKTGFSTSTMVDLTHGLLM